ncbi:MAG: hypothetical protein R3D33_02145 [Hyphomicrobiaceae bacterium]
MITLEDCLAFCDLTEDEVRAIAEHEHIPDMAAAALAQCLLAEEHGPERIRDMLRDDVRAAIARGDAAHARELIHTLHCFLGCHPEAIPQWTDR